jgi:hypothetical protein
VAIIGAVTAVGANMANVFNEVGNTQVTWDSAHSQGCALSQAIVDKGKIHSTR